MQGLFEAVRAACATGTWSKAIELVRHFAVTQQSAENGVISCRVRLLNRAIPAEVHLYPEDAEWDCDCESRAPCCEHVAAAVIAIKRAQTEGKPLPAAMTSSANLGYRFLRHQGELRVERLLVRADGTKTPLKLGLATIISQHAAGFDFAPSQEDLQIDRYIGPGGLVRPDQILAVLKLLVGHANLEFEGKPIVICSEPLRPSATVSAVGDSFLVRVTPDPSVQQIVASFVALTDAGLAPLGATDFCGPKYERLVPERLFGPEELAILVTQVLPEYKRWFSLHVRTDKLPEVTSDERPRIVIELRQDGDQLDVLATLVYGDPPVARVDRGTLVHLEGPIPMRKLELERRAMEHLRQSLGLSVGTRLVVTGKDALQFASRLDRWQGEIVGTDVERWVQEIPLRPKLMTGESLPRFCATDADGRELIASAEASIKAYRAGLSQVPLLDGGFARLPMEWLAQHAALIERILAALTVGSEQRLPGFLAPALARIHESLQTKLPEHLAPVRQLLAGLEQLPEATLKGDWATTLRPYQRQGVNWLSLMKQLELGVVLADDMGLGKTVQVLAILGQRSLLVCPTSLVSNWVAELQRHRPKLTFSVYQGKDRQISDEADVTLMSYAHLRIDLDELSQRRWNVVVLDEAQAIKNPDSQVAQAAYRLQADFRIALTGTPIENRLDDLWSLVHFTNPGLLGTREAFQIQYIEPIQIGQRDVAAQLQQLIAPFLLRRTKQAVLPDLPEKLERDLYIDLAPAERELYVALHLTAQREITEQLASGQSMMQALAVLLRLRQAACHPALVPGQSAESSSKIDLLLERLGLAIAGGHRSLVFSQWTSFLDLIEPHLRHSGIEFLRLDGTTKDRGKVVDQFQSEDGPRVMLLSLKAGGTGLNLTAADHVFLMDLWWNPAVEQQAADRTHRIGQTRPVFVHRLVAKDSVEERIVALHTRKRDLSDTLLENADQATSISREDLLELLS